MSRIVKISAQTSALLSLRKRLWPSSLVWRCIDPFFVATMTGRVAPQFPPHSEPRVWLLTSGRSPVAIALARQLLAHGDLVAAGVRSQDFNNDDERDAELKSMLRDAGEAARSRLKLVDLDIRYASDYWRFR